MHNPGELGSSNYPVSPSLPLLLTPQVNLTQQCAAGPSGGVVSNLMGERGGGKNFHLEAFIKEELCTKALKHW